MLELSGEYDLVVIGGGSGYLGSFDGKLILD
jgi:hypothetical protein